MGREECLIYYSTPFILACRFQTVELAKYLLEKAANLYAIDNNGFAVSGHCPTKGLLWNLLEKSFPNAADFEYICPPETAVTEWDEKPDTEALPFFISYTAVSPTSHRQPNQHPRPNGGLHSAVRR